MDRLELLETRKKVIEYLKDQLSSLKKIKGTSDYGFCKALSLKYYYDTFEKEHPFKNEIEKLHFQGFELQYMLPELLRAKLEIDEKFYVVKPHAEYWFQPSDYKSRLQCCDRALEIINEEIDTLKPSGTFTATEVTFNKISRKIIDRGIDVTRVAREWDDQDMYFNDPVFSKEMYAHFDLEILPTGPINGKITNQIIEDKILELLQEIKI